MKGLKAFIQGGQAATTVDADAIRRLSALLNETGLSEIEIEQNGSRIRVARDLNGNGGAPAEIAQVGASAPNRAVESKGPAVGAVTSPMVGTVYVSPEPGAAPFVKVGQSVKEGDTLLIVEAMKTMNPITAPHAGVITEICVNDSQPVEFGQTLLVIG